MKTNMYAKLTPIMISIIVFILLVFTAGYAFYSATVHIENVTNISSRLPKMTTLDTLATDCGMDVTPAMMTPENANQNYAQACQINVTINGSRTAFCTYDIYVEEISINKYVPSNGVGEATTPVEFTGQISGSASTEEIQMDILSDHNFLTHEVITVVQDDTPVTKTYTLTEKWYNLDLNQDIHANKSYYYRFKIENVAC